MTDDELAEIHAASFTTPRPWSPAEFQALRASPLTVLVIGTDGFALGRVVADEAELLTIAVRPASRRLGKGRHLLQEFLLATRERGAERVFLEVAADNHPAIALYQDCAFAQTGRRKNYYVGPSGKTDALTFQRRLDRAKPPGGQSF